MMIYYDFGFYLTIAALVTGVIVLIDKLKWRKKRVADGLKFDEKGQEVMPFAIDISRSFFPVILIVLLLRSFLYEPYRIPSGSMNPGLYDGDFILVNKFAYGIRLPIFNTKIIPVGEPQRGDVIVFHPPEIDNPERAIQPAYIKRLIGLPGDKLEWKEGALTITPKCDSKPCPSFQVNPQYISAEVDELVKQGNYFDTYKEVVGDVEHELLYVDKNIGGRSLNQHWTRIVPEGKYFAMGDHRDNSLDSRAWLNENPNAFIDKNAFIGRAAAKWLFVSFTEEPVFTVFGKPIYLPKGVSFDRVGAIK